MNTGTVLISAITAFIIAAGGALGVVFVGGAPTNWQITAAVVLGLCVAAKDTRSLLKLPPVKDTGDSEPRAFVKPVEPPDKYNPEDGADTNNSKPKP